MINLPKCECVWGALSCPVADNEVYACFEQALKLELLAKKTQAFVLAMMQTCRGKTQLMSQPCGTCDKYKSLRAECGSRTNRTNLFQERVSLTSKQAAETADAPAKGGAVRRFGGAAAGGALAGVAAAVLIAGVGI